jgi:hypothetical protein
LLSKGIIKIKKDYISDKLIECYSIKPKIPGNQEKYLLDVENCFEKNKTTVDSSVGIIYDS